MKTKAGRVFGPGGARLLCVALAVVVGVEVANYHPVARIIAWALLGTDEDTGPELLVYCLRFVAPGAILLVVIGAFAILRSVGSSAYRVFGIVLGIAVIEIALLVLSVVVYYRLFVPAVG